MVRLLLAHGACGSVLTQEWFHSAALDELAIHP